MKKFLIILLIVLTLCFISCDYNPKSISLKYVDSITIKLLYFPPKMKKITKKNDLEEIINFLNTLDYNTTKQVHTSESLLSIEVEGELHCSLIFADNLVRINGTWYEVNDNTLIELRNIYNNLQYDEIPISLLEYSNYNKNN
ncbi:MAG TPA: hypothetical protein DCL31_17640 [Clostridium sp.]|nr:hypothetical protein [Clostridium sp.]